MKKKRRVRQRRVTLTINRNKRMLLKRKKNIKSTVRLEMKIWMRRKVRKKMAKTMSQKTPSQVLKTI